jgi:hypothetical protein
VDAAPGSGMWAYVAIAAAVMIVLYIVGRVAVDAATDPATSDVGNFVRYTLVGLNAGANLIFIAALYDGLLGATAAKVVGAIVTLVLLLSVFESISTSDVYEGFIGWLNPFLPMSWPIVALGAAFFFFSLFLGLVLGLPGVDYCKVLGVKVDWKTGTISMKGGLIANLNPIDTAFNMGDFSFVDKNSPEWHIDHEAGHGLNLAAFGFLFHLIGALDENVLGGGNKAFSERLAESNVPGTSLSGIVIPMWA